MKRRARLRSVPEGSSERTGRRPEVRQARAVLTAPSAQRRRPGELLTWPAPCAGRPGAPPPSTATSGAREEMREMRVWRHRARLPSTTGPRPPHPGPALHDQAPPSISRSRLSLPSPTLPRLGLALYSQDMPILPSPVLYQTQKTPQLTVLIHLKSNKQKPVDLQKRIKAEKQAPAGTWSTRPNNRLAL